MAEEKQQPEIEPEMEIEKGGEDKEWEDDEVFYERIEAPKFVDFTTPDHYRPDDRYWFCLRVGMLIFLLFYPQCSVIFLA